MEAVFVIASNIHQRWMDISTSCAIAMQRNTPSSKKKGPMESSNMEDAEQNQPDTKEDVMYESSSVNFWIRRS